MEKYIFILGRNFQLCAAEILAIFKNSQVIRQTERFLLLNASRLDCRKAIGRPGGTIKIGKWISENITAETIADDLSALNLPGKIRFGISDYSMKAKKSESRQAIKMGMEVKKLLKEKGLNARVVTSREPTLSSVVITKNKCQEYIIAENMLFRTGAVQDFEDYSSRDYGRPAVDAKSGMLPPKLAKMMINLSGAKYDDILLDPFCGSGTILQEAILLGYKNLIGSDISEKAVEDTKKNLEWIKKELRITNYELSPPLRDPAFFKKLISEAGQFKIQNLKISKIDARQISQYIKKVDCIITEPYLGPALKGKESKKEIEGIITDLSELYLDAFREFKKILKPDGRIVIVFPVFKLGNELLKLPIEKNLLKMGFERKNSQELFYSRPDQKVFREIIIFNK